MPLTPDEIVNYQLKQAVRGYSVKQVDELLDQVADEIERLQAELAEAKGRLGTAETQAGELAETEATLKRTLVTAQRAAEQTLEEAQSRAQEILEEATREAESLVRDAEENAASVRATQEREVVAVEQRIADLRERERVYREALRATVERHLADLDVLDAEALAARAGELGSGGLLWEQQVGQAVDQAVDQAVEPAADPVVEPEVEPGEAVVVDAVEEDLVWDLDQGDRASGDDETDGDARRTDERFDETGRDDLV